VKCIPTEAWDAILEAKDMSEDEALEYLQTWLDQATNGVTYEFGEITGTAWDDDEVQELNETLSRYLDGDITSAMTCTFGISAEIDGEEVQLELDETFIEYDGEWYFDPMTFAGYLDGSGEDGGNVGGTPGTYPGYNENGNENGGSNSSSDIAYNSFSSGEAAVDAYLQASVYDFDARAAVSTMPEELVTKACENQNMTLDQLIAQLQVSLDNSKNLLSAYEYSTTVSAVTELTGTQMANYLKPYAGIFSGEITAINQYTVTVSVPGETSQNLILTAACYEGRWYIFGM
jgi:hypothetical protein